MSFYVLLKGKIVCWFHHEVNHFLTITFARLQCFYMPHYDDDSDSLYRLMVHFWILLHNDGLFIFSCIKVLSDLFYSLQYY